VRLEGALGRERLELFVDEAHLGWGVHLTDDRFHDHLGKLAFEWSRLPWGLALEAGGSARLERVALSDAMATVAPPPSRRSTAGGFVVARLTAAGDRVTLHAGRRWDRLTDALRWTANGAEKTSDVARVLNTPQLGVRVAAPAGIELRANWTDASRPPELMELFGNQGASQGNPGLLPERAEGWDAGLAWSGAPGAARATAEWAHFESRARDLIVFVRNSPNSVKPMNVARATIRGDELSARMVLGGLSAQLAATWQSAVDRGPVPFWNGKRLPLRPERQWSARLGWEGSRFGAAVDLQFLGENFLDRYNRVPVPSRALTGATLFVAPFTFPVRVLVEGHNLGDDRVADVSGYPLPGRSVYVSIQARSGPSSHR
jgi:outer membrane receptor protein involved in Fe transport